MAMTAATDKIDAEISSVETGTLQRLDVDLTTDMKELKTLEKGIVNEGKKAKALFNDVMEIYDDWKKILASTSYITSEFPTLLDALHQSEKVSSDLDEGFKSGNLVDAVELFYKDGDAKRLQDVYQDLETVYQDRQKYMHSIVSIERWAENIDQVVQQAIEFCRKHDDKSLQNARKAETARRYHKISSKVSNKIGKLSHNIDHIVHQGIEFVKKKEECGPEMAPAPKEPLTKRFSKKLHLNGVLKRKQKKEPEGENGKETSPSTTEATSSEPSTQPNPDETEVCKAKGDEKEELEGNKGESSIETGPDDKKQETSTKETDGSKEEERKLGEEEGEEHKNESEEKEGGASSSTAEPAATEPGSKTVLDKNTNGAKQDEKGYEPAPSEPSAQTNTNDHGQNHSIAANEHVSMLDESEQLVFSMETDAKDLVSDAYDADEFIKNNQGTLQVFANDAKTMQDDWKPSLKAIANIQSIIPLVNQALDEVKAIASLIKNAFGAASLNPTAMIGLIQDGKEAFDDAEAICTLSKKIVAVVKAIDILKTFLTAAMGLVTTGRALLESYHRAVLGDGAPHQESNKEEQKEASTDVKEEPSADQEDLSVASVSSSSIPSAPSSTSE